MITENLMYDCNCDNCGKEWMKYDGTSVYTDINAIKCNIMDSGWTKDGDKHYCPDCYYYDDEDNLKLKEIKL